MVYFLNYNVCSNHPWLMMSFAWPLLFPGVYYKLPDIGIIVTVYLCLLITFPESLKPNISKKEGPLDVSTRGLCTVYASSF